MPKIVGVKFDFNPKVYYFAPGELQVKEGDEVVVETSRGLDYGTVTMPISDVDDKKIVGKLMPVKRIATPEDADRFWKSVRSRIRRSPKRFERADWT